MLPNSDSSKGAVVEQADWLAGIANWDLVTNN